MLKFTSLAHTAHEECFNLGSKDRISSYSLLQFIGMGRLKDTDEFHYCYLSSIIVWLKYKQFVYFIRICTRLTNSGQWDTDHTYSCDYSKYINYSLFVDRYIIIYLRTQNSKSNKIIGNHDTNFCTHEQISWAVDIGISNSVSVYYSIWNNYCWNSTCPWWFCIFITVICSVYTSRSCIIFSQEITEFSANWR